MNKYFFILFLLLVHTLAIAQTPAKPSFILEGTIDADSGQMSMFAHDDDAYLPAGVSGSTTIQNGKFTFSGTMGYPCQVMLGVKVSGKWSYVSHSFYIVPGTQYVTCHIDSSREIPAIVNTSMQEYLGSYRDSRTAGIRLINEVLAREDSLHQVYGKTMSSDMTEMLASAMYEAKYKADMALLHYVAAHNTSYVALWELENHVQSWYKPIYDTIFELFTTEVKNSRTGQVLANKLTNANYLAVGRKFPQLKVVDTAGISRQIPILNGNAKYTLIDFWFTHCAACKSQFPSLKKIYAQYHGKGFDMIAISTDAQQYIALWKEMIVHDKLPWGHYLDVGGTLANKMAINAFPRNYLLDRSGRIIKIDMTTDELKDFLDAKL